MNDPTRPAPLRIGNCSGFYGDRLSAAREMVDGGPIDVLTGDWLAELTMLVLAKSRAKGRGGGYAHTFLQQLEQVLGTCLDRGIKVVSNAGGLDPQACAEAIRELGGKLGLAPKVAYVDGDDVLSRLDDFIAGGCGLINADTGERFTDFGAAPVTANAYLGGSPIAEALRRGADVVVTGRITDAALVTGPGMWHFGWDSGDLDELAAAVVAGHVIECGCQATGGNYAFFREVPGLEDPGFPLAELHADGSAVITKHPGTGGLVSTGTVTAQLLYEISGPRYATPDAVARFDTVRLDQVGADRVRISGVRGEPPPSELKVAINYEGGYRNSMTLLLNGLDVAEKAHVAEKAIWRRVPGGRDAFDHSAVELLGTGTDPHVPAMLRMTVMDRDERKVGRAFSSAVVETGLANYPGFHALTPPGGASSYGVYWPTFVPTEYVRPRVVLDGDEIPVPHSPVPMGTNPLRLDDELTGTPPTGSAERVPLGTLAGARAGDKGGNANVGVWVRTPEEFAWLDSYLTVERLRELLPETADLRIDRYRLPNLFALNFVVIGLLGRGVAASTRLDPQAKALGEQLRACLVDVPESLLTTASSSSRTSTRTGG
ncbi:acyclic terpene utilization AtuA family protein [Parasphingorhabdus pacifica]